MSRLEKEASFLSLEKYMGQTTLGLFIYYIFFLSTDEICPMTVPMQTHCTNTTVKGNSCQQQQEHQFSGSRVLMFIVTVNILQILN